MNAAEAVIYGRAIRNTKIEHPPIFILGHWRSGTTLLHNLMTLDSQVTYPNLYQCVYPGHFLLTERILAPLTAWMLPKTRPMDNMSTSWKAAIEDEVAIAIDCGISPYLMLAFHDRPDLYDRYFDPCDMTDSERSRWKKSLCTLMKKLTIVKNKSIVLKSPSHTYRIPTLLEMFPDSKFVYISRDPYAVFLSTLHLRNTMFVQNSLGPPRLQNYEEEVLHYYEKCIRRYEETKSLIPPERLHELRFEDLEADPQVAMEQIYKQLDLPGWETEVEEKIRMQLASMKSYKKNTFEMDPEQKRKVFERLRWVFDLYGYPD